MQPYTAYPALVDLPPLVRAQQKLVRQLVLLKPLDVDEKAARARIFALLVLAGIPRGEGVTCVGYDVMCRGKKGNTTINADALILRLVATGMAERLAIEIVAACEVTGEPSAWAEVNASKGSKVRLPMAKAALPAKRKRA